MNFCPMTKSEPAPLVVPMWETMPYCLFFDKPHAAFWSVGMSCAAASMLKTVPPIVKFNGWISETEDAGTVMRPVLWSSLAPGMAFMYESKKSSARRTTGNVLKSSASG